MVFWVVGVDLYFGRVFACTCLVALNRSLVLCFIPWIGCWISFGVYMQCGLDWLLVVCFVLYKLLGGPWIALFFGCGIFVAGWCFGFVACEFCGGGLVVCLLSYFVFVWIMCWFAVWFGVDCGVVWFFGSNLLGSGHFELWILVCVFVL